ncbi:MAG: hypothetical protein MZU97_21475 [Bacillus subtilis]|nr:hypothetical protein [Bacillus subtilis]
MRKIVLLLVLMLTASVMACSTETTSTTTAKVFDATKNITVYTRDTTSGTRTGFMEGDRLRRGRRRAIPFWSTAF